MNENREMSIRLKDLIRVFLKRLWILLLAAVIVASAVFVYQTANYTEQYTSSSTIMVMNPEENLSASSSSYYYTLTISAVVDCEQLLKSKTVLTQIVDELKLEEYGITASRLHGMIDVSRIPDSHILRVSVTSGNAKMSKAIVDLLCQEGAAQIEKHITFATARVIDEGSLNESPSNSVSVLFAIVSGIAAALAVFAVLFIIELSDDKIKTPEDIEERLGLSVLGVIPLTELESEVGIKNKRSRRKVK